MGAVTKMDQPAPMTLSAVIVERVRAGTTIEELRELYKFQREIEADANKAAFATAYSAMQAELPEIPERGRIDFGKGMKSQGYALWEDTNALIKPVLSKHGFALDFSIERAENMLTVTAYLTCHGYTKQTSLPLPFDTSGSKNAVQAIGSSVSYGKRYTAGALLNLTSRGEDDDGKSATGKNGNGNGHLTKAQVDDLRAAIDEAGADVGRFCKVYNIARLEDFPARRLPEAMAKLAAFRRQQESRS